MSLPDSSPERTPYFPYIDGLRAIAVLSVLVYHLHGPWLPGGFVGVDVFFVISGFVVSGSMAHFQGRGLRAFLAYFYARRLKRIAPALIVCLLITSILTALFIPVSWLSDANQKTGLFAFFGLSNFILARNGRDYFAPTSEFNPFTHTWSLGVEEQFYLIFPFLFVAWLSGQRGRRLSITLVAAAFLASLAWGALQTQTDPIKAYYLTPSRFWELAAGVLLFQWIESRKASPVAAPNLARMATGAGSLLLLLLAFVLTPAANFPVPAVLPAVLGTLGVIWSLHRHGELRSLHRLLGNAPLVFVGRISYSLYLWHWPIFVLFRWTIGLEGLVPRALAVGLTFLLAIASWRFVEQPVRNGHRMRSLASGQVIAGGLLVVGCSFLLAMLIGNFTDRLSLSTVNQNASIWYPNVTPIDPHRPGCYAEPERQRVAGGRLWVYEATGCATPDARNRGSLYVIGDSHAAAYDELFKQFAKRTGTVVYVYANGCSFVSLQPWRDSEDPVCRQINAAAIGDLLSRVKAGDVLFLPSLRLARLSDQWSYLGERHARNEMLSPMANAGRRRAVADAVTVLDAVSRRGVHIVLEGPKPVFMAPPFRCADWFNRSNPICSRGFTTARALLDSHRRPVPDSFAEIIRQVPGASVWDPYPILCPDEQCGAWRGGQPLFFDGDHLSSYGNRLLLPSFEDALRNLLEGQARPETL